VAIFKEISSADVKTARSFLNQLIDIIQQDVSGSSTRRKYQAFVTGGVGPGVTSSLFQTVYDQDFSLQTANAIFDMTVGLFSSGSVVNASTTGQDAAGKLLFQSSSLMMREKVDVYKQFAQTLLGNANTQFAAPIDSTTTTDLIDPAMFVCFKRLFSRDKIKRETFAMKFFVSASATQPNLVQPLTTNEQGLATVVLTDIGSSNNKNFAFGGEVGSIVNAANTATTVGLLFYDRGIAVLDINKVVATTQVISGVISGMNSVGGTSFSAGQTLIGGSKGAENPNAKFVPDLMVSGSIDNIVDHICSVRFGAAAQTAITFQNVTNINSTLVFCRAEADEMNYSSNPTFVDADSRIVCIDPGQEDTQQTFTFVTSVGLYDANDNLLAVAKLSRPIEKSPERDLTLRVRIDF
jgi:hypothetical protein